MFPIVFPRVPATALVVALAFAHLSACRTPGGVAAASGAESEATGGFDDDLVPDFWPSDASFADWMPSWDFGPAAGEPLWHRSGHDAIQIARRDEKPILLWMSHPLASALDVALKSEVMDSGELASLLRERVVGLRIDWSDPQTTESAYYRGFRERYRGRGFPSVFLLLPDGAEIARYTGYRPGTGAGWIDRLESDLEKAEAAWQARRQTLAGRDFRDWHSTDGGRLFARALGRSGSDAVLVDAFGRRHRIPLARFDAESLSDLLDLPDPAEAPQ